MLLSCLVTRLFDAVCSVDGHSSYACDTLVVHVCGRVCMSMVGDFLSIWNAFWCKLLYNSFYARKFCVQNERWVSQWSVSVSYFTTISCWFLFFYLMNKGSAYDTFAIRHCTSLQLHWRIMVQQLIINDLKTSDFAFVVFLLCGRGFFFTLFFIWAMCDFTFCVCVVSFLFTVSLYVCVCVCKRVTCFWLLQSLQKLT